jgi:hypothetical protein
MGRMGRETGGEGRQLPLGALRGLDENKVQSHEGFASPGENKVQSHEGFASPGENKVQSHEGFASPDGNKVQSHEGFASPDEHGAIVQANEGLLPSGRTRPEADKADEKEKRRRKVRRSYYPSPPGGLSKHADSGRDEAETGRAFSESLDQTVEATSAWLGEMALEFGAHCINPVLGLAVTIVFKVKEVVDDVEALTDPTSGLDLHVPLVHLPPGLEIELNVQLGDSGESGPSLSGFVVPGDGGLFGGWALERDKRQDTDEQERLQRDLGSRRQAQVIPYDLSKVVEATEDPLFRAIILRERASRLRDQLWTTQEYKDKPLIVVSDERTGCGLWMIRSSRAISGWQIELRPDTETGLLTVRIV